MNDILTRLEETLRVRKGASAETSYVAQLLAKGPDKVAKKFGEEAIELAMASAQGSTKQVAYEAADVLFHLMVLLAAHNIPLADILQELSRREGISGLEEKASRT